VMEPRKRWRHPSSTPSKKGARDTPATMDEEEEVPVNFGDDNIEPEVTEEVEQAESEEEEVVDDIEAALAAKRAAATEDEDLEVCRLDELAAAGEIPSDLEPSPQAFDILHEFSLPWPALSLDFLRQQDTDSYVDRKDEGLNLFMVAGSSGLTNIDHALYVMKLSQLHRTYKDDSDDSDDEPEDPKLEHNVVCTYEPINRVAVCPQFDQLTAIMTPSGLQVLNIKEHLDSLVNGSVAPALSGNYSTYAYRGAEGFGLEWTSKDGLPAVLSAHGDKLVMHGAVTSGFEVVREFNGHSGEIECVSSHRQDPNVFVTGSTDRSMIFWDARAPGPQLVVKNAHSSDVNAVAFRPSEELNQVLSGGDEGNLIIRDMRYPEEHLCRLDFHKSAVSSVNWSETDTSTFMATSFDDTVSVWDPSLEAANPVPGLPPQLLFHNFGRRMLSSGKFHPYIPFLSVTTGERCFQVCRPETLNPSYMVDESILGQ